MNLSRRWQADAAALVIGVSSFFLFYVLQTGATPAVGEGAPCVMMLLLPLLGILGGLLLRIAGPRAHTIRRSVLASAGTYLVACICYNNAGAIEMQRLSEELFPFLMSLIILFLSWTSTMLAYSWGNEPEPCFGVCSKCGYDLTGNQSGRCPECGTPVGRQ